MTLEDIKANVTSMSEAEQDRLAAFLVHLRHSRDVESRQEITAKVDSKDTSQWISVQELREKWKD